MIATFGALATPLADLAIKSSLLVLAGVVVVALLRSASPASRHLVWTAVLAGVLLLPLSRTMLPEWRVPVPAMGPVTVDIETAVPTASSVPPPRDVRAGSTDGNSALPSISGIAGLLWLAGIATMCLRFLAGTIGLRRLAHRARRTEDARVVVRVQRLAERLNITRPVVVLSGATDAIPITWGVVYPTVLLPSTAPSWDDERLDAVLLHELGHVTRLDALTQLIGQFAMTIAWFNPLVALASRRATIERERACDDIVLTHGPRASQYADHLVALTQSLAPQRVPGFAALAMTRGGDIKGRILAILDPGLDRRRASPRAATLAAGMLAVTFGMSSLHPVPESAFDDTASLQGTWTIVAAEIDGSKQSPPAARATITISGSAFTTSSMGAEYTGTFTLGSEKGRKTIDMHFVTGPEAGHTALAIYQLAGESWTLCISFAQGARPTAFAAGAGSGQALETLTHAPAESDMTKLQGTWSALRIESSGSPLPDMYLTTAKRVASHDTLTVTVAGQTIIHARFSVDTTTKPKSMDYEVLDGADKGKKMLVSYVLDKELSTCYAPVGSARPLSMRTQTGDGITCSTWKKSN